MANSKDTKTIVFFTAIAFLLPHIISVTIAGLLGIGLNMFTRKDLFPNFTSKN